MNLIVVGSSSRGNAYLLDNGKTALLIECGVAFKEIQKALNFQIHRVAGCLISHEHSDHASSAQHVLTNAIDVYASGGTIGALFPSPSTIVKHRLTTIKGGEETKIGEFTVLPFNVQHDASEPLGFLIHHADCGNVLFLTDSYYSKYKFRDLNQIMVECNYSNEILNTRHFNGHIHPHVRNRVLQSHMSLDTVVDLLKANDLSQVNNIVLLHLSSSNSDAGVFTKKVKETTGKPTYIADDGLIVNFSKKTPF